MAKRSNGPGERISEAEHAVMEVLWDRSPISAAEVCEAICADRDWSNGQRPMRMKSWTRGAVMTRMMIMIKRRKLIKMRK